MVSLDAPMPRTTRPGASWASDPVHAAMTEGVRVYTGTTAVPIRSFSVHVATAAPTTKASGPAPVSATQTLSYPSDSTRSATRRHMARSGGTGRLAATRMGALAWHTRGGVTRCGSPLLVLHGSADVPPAPQQIAQPGYDVADAADVEVSRPVGVVVEPAAANLGLHLGRRHDVDVQTGKTSELVQVERMMGGVEQGQRVRGGGRRPVQHRTDRGDAGVDRDEDGLGVGGPVEEEGPPWPCEVERRPGRQTEQVAGAEPLQHQVEQQLDALRLLGTRGDRVWPDHPVAADREQTGQELTGPEAEAPGDAEEEGARVGTVIGDGVEDRGALLSHACRQSG